MASSAPLRPSTLSPSTTPPPLPPTKSGSPQWEPSLASLPDDVALGVASFLGAGDLCSLGSCSRYWRRLCSSDFLWASLCRRRWHPVDATSSRFSGEEGPSASASSCASRSPTFPFSPPAQEWRSFYIRCHQEMAGRASKVIKFVKHCCRNDSLEVGDYLKAIAALHSLDLGFVDVKFFLLTAKHTVLLNLIGLHYAMFYLKGTDVMEAVQCSQISERQVCVNWFKLGRWFYGFRLPDESRSRKLSLLEFATTEEEVRNLLNRGAIHEVLRVQITSVVPATS